MKKINYLVLRKSYTKTMNRPYKLLLLLILLITQITFGQNPGDNNGYSVWEHNIKDTQRGKGFLNYHQPLKSIKKEVFKKIINNKYSFFMVFKSDQKEETNLIKIKDGRNKVYFTNKRIISNKDKDYDKKIDKGMFISFLTQYSKKPSFKNYLKIYNNNFKNTESNNKIYEILYYPKYLKPIELAKVQTYFSIKYGISLPEESSYLNSKNDTIWNSKNNKGYNKRVTGLALDKKMNLNQFKSHNSIYKNLSIEFNKKSINLKKNNFYVLFGDNNRDLQFKKNNKHNIEALNRVWKVNTTSDNPNFNTSANFNFSLDLENKTEENEADVLWMVIDYENTNTIDYENSIYIKGEKTNNFYSFKNVSLSNKQALFSFVKTPKMNCIVNTIQEPCVLSGTGKIEIDIKGGVSPYTISINSEDYNQRKKIDKTNFQFSELIEGTYNLSIIDSKGQTYNKIVVIEGNLGSIKLDSKWLLDDTNKGVKIIPDGDYEVLDKMQYNWYLEEELVGTEQVFTAFKSGIYQLSVKNDSGCEQKFIFSVETKSKSFLDDITIYPNPVDINRNFKILFNFEKENNVNVSIFTLDGKQIKSDDYKGIQKQSKFYSLSVTGVYLVIIKSNNKFITRRIIIK